MAAFTNVDSRSPVHKQMDSCCLSMGAAVGPPLETHNIAAVTAASQPEDCALCSIQTLSASLCCGDALARRIALHIGLQTM